MAVHHQAMRACLPLLACPLCRESFTLQAGSLKCPSRHTYDIAARGYAHLAPDKAQPMGYDRPSFINRGAFLAAGYYNHILEAVLQALPQGPWVDAGCGQGWLTAAAARRGFLPAVGLDLAREGVRQAAALSKQVCWLVADLARMPLQDGVLEAVVNVFSPANYSEFLRVLKPEGLVLKVMPGPLHLRELRLLTRELLPPEGPETGHVADHFARHLTVQADMTLTRTLPLPREHRGWLLAMTPLLFGKALGSLPLHSLTHITIDARLLVGGKERT